MSEGEQPRGNGIEIEISLSTVTPTIMEPFPGWVDNFNGPIGLAAAGSTGIYRFMNMKSDTCLDFQPVDVVAKSIILSTWKQANVRESLSGDLPIYNSSSFGKCKKRNGRKEDLN